MLKVGGLLCYSTCSISPIEDEAVVVEVFRRLTEMD
jgi:16S rRNA C967 or C1407 C5-methylase (RsmB/RsmF family)